MDSKIESALIVLVNHMHFGGCQKIIFDIMLGANNYIDKIYLIANKGHYSTMLENETNICFVDRKLLSKKDIFIKIRSIQKKHSKLILHTHNRIDLVFKYALTKKNNHLHTFHSAYLNKNYLYKFIKPKHAISISKTVKNYLNSYRIPSKIIYNGIDDLQHFLEPGKPKKFKVKYIGRVTKAKGFDNLLEAFINLKKQYPKFKETEMEVIGNGNSISFYKEKLKHSGFESDVKFLGFVKEPWRGANVNELVVIPSHFEGFCLVAAEAASLGIPIIGNDILALREVLDFLPDRNFFDIKNEDSVHKTFNFFLENKEKQKILVANHKEEIKNKFSKSQMILQYLDAYQSFT